MSDPVSEERLREIAERCDWVLSDERQSMARELLAAREQLRLADALAEAVVCTCTATVRQLDAASAYLAARSAR